MIIEYTRAVERLLVVLCCPALLWVGYKLFVMGAKGEINISAKRANDSISVGNLAPGTFCFLLGVLLGAYVLLSKVNATYNYDYPDEPAALQQLYSSTCALLKDPAVSAQAKAAARDAYRRMYEAAGPDASPDGAPAKLDQCKAP